MTPRRRLVLMVVAVAALSVGALTLSLTRRRAPVWTLERDGWEHTHLKAPNGGPVYVRRLVAQDHCLFGDFPDSGELPVVRVACGETWHGTETALSLTCECLPLP